MEVADFLDGLTSDFRGVDISLCRHFSSQHNLPSRYKRFNRHAASGILGQDRVENRVADLVGHLVRMAHGDGFTGEKMGATAEFRIHNGSFSVKFGRKVKAKNLQASARGIKCQAN